MSGYGRKGNKDRKRHDVDVKLFFASWWDEGCVLRWWGYCGGRTKDCNVFYDSIEDVFLFNGVVDD